jgi:hypothetical protein
MFTFHAVQELSDQHPSHIFVSRSPDGEESEIGDTSLYDWRHHLSSTWSCAKFPPCTYSKRNLYLAILSALLFLETHKPLVVS